MVTLPATTANSFEVEEPQLPRRRKASRRFDDGLRLSHNPTGILSSALLCSFRRDHYMYYWSLWSAWLQSVRSTSAASPQSMQTKRVWIWAPFRLLFLWWLPTRCTACTATSLGIHFSSEKPQNVTIFDVRDYFLSLSCAQRSLLYIKFLFSYNWYLSYLPLTLLLRDRLVHCAWLKPIP